MTLVLYIHHLVQVLCIGLTTTEGKGTTTFIVIGHLSKVLPIIFYWKKEQTEKRNMYETADHSTTLRLPPLKYYNNKINVLI